jgi:hypothetical protein
MQRHPNAKRRSGRPAPVARIAAALAIVAIVVAVVLVLRKPKNSPPAGAPTSQGSSTEPTVKPSTAHDRAMEEMAKTVLSDGRDVRDQRRVFFVRNAAKPQGEAGIVLPGLRARAMTGDAAASFALWQWLDACARQASRANPDPSIDCTGVGAADFAERLTFLEFAAAHGEPNAVLQFPITASMRFLGPDGRPDGTVLARDSEAYVEFRRNAMAYLEASALSGNVRALNALADAYSLGLLVQQDRVAALAYALAADRTGLSQGAGPWIERLSSPLSPAERQRAEAQAREIFRRCCR